MIISSNREGEAAWDSFTCAIRVGTFQSAAGEHSLLGIIEGNGTKFFPVADQLILDNDLMNREFTLDNRHLSIVSRRASVRELHSHLADFRLVPQSVVPSHYFRGKSRLFVANNTPG